MAERIQGIDQQTFVDIVRENVCVSQKLGQFILDDFTIRYYWQIEIIIASMFLQISCSFGTFLHFINMYLGNDRFLKGKAVRSLLRRIRETDGKRNAMKFIKAIHDRSPDTDW